jgi:hypothetical protein
MVDGREVRTIMVDPERAPLVRKAFSLYASGEFALSELASILEAEGLRSRATRKGTGTAALPLGGEAGKKKLQVIQARL